MPLGLVRREVEHEYEVGRMSGGAEHSSTGTRLVDWTLVNESIGELVDLAGTEPYHRQRVVEYLRLRLGKHHTLAVPAGTLDKQALTRLNTNECDRNSDKCDESTL